MLNEACFVFVVRVFCLLCLRVCLQTFEAVGLGLVKALA